MMKPRLLDLFSCAGGAGAGYAEYFDVTGVDMKPQPHYPFPFIQADALAFLDTADLSQFDVIHASPECKAYTNCNLSPKERYLKLIGEVRTRLVKTGKPYVIENVMGARRDLHASLMLCGSMFGLPMQRHRLFETNVFIYPPCPCNHKDTPIQVYGHSVWDASRAGTPRKDGRKRPDSVSAEIGYQAMQIDWMNKIELAQAIPPAYTRWIGQFLYDVVTAEREVAI
jgi:DNA (cytosine-5)-methyltransferase 1